MPTLEERTGALVTGSAGFVWAQSNTGPFDADPSAAIRRRLDRDLSGRPNLGTGRDATPDRQPAVGVSDDDQDVRNDVAIAAGADHAGAASDVRARASRASRSRTPQRRAARMRSTRTVVSLIPRVYAISFVVAPRAA